MWSCVLEIRDGKGWRVIYSMPFLSEISAMMAAKSYKDRVFPNQRCRVVKGGG